MQVRDTAEALFIACEMEKRAIRLYERALAVFADGPCQEAIRAILEDERRHLARFKEMGGEASDFVRAQLLAAQAAGAAEVELGDRERLAEDARRRLHDRLVVARRAALDVRGLVDVERQLLVAGLRMVSVAVVVNELERVALVGLRGVVPPVAPGDQRPDACVP